MPAVASEKPRPQYRRPQPNRRHSSMEVLDWIERRIAAQGYPPSFRDIGRALHIPSVSTVAYHIKELIEEGFVRQERGVPRSLRLTPSGKTAAAVWRAEQYR